MTGQVLTPSSAKHRSAFDELLAMVGEYNPDVDRQLLEGAFAFACDAHEGQRRRSGEDFIVHPVGVAQIAAELRLDTATVAASLLHDVVEDTSASNEVMIDEFGEEVARLVEGVTKLTRIQFASQEQAQVENYRKMIVAMAQDVRVILVKLADRLHNMRTIEYLGKQKRIQKARETLEIYAPIAHRLGMHAIKAELEDRSFQTLHPRKYREITTLVDQRRADRETYVEQAGDILAGELERADITAEISGRAKHFYSIYEKMAKGGKEFNEIYDLTAMRVIVASEGASGQGDCYAVLGIIHSLWKPMPGRFKDYIAMPKLNLYSALHTTVIGPEGKPLEIQLRTRGMHQTAEFGVAAHWLYKESRKEAKDEAQRLAWLGRLNDWQREESDPGEFMRNFVADLTADEVFVFTPLGEVKSLPVGSTPIDFAYAVHTDVGHRTVGAKVSGRIVPLHYKLQSGDFVEILTSNKPDRGPSRDWLTLAVSSKARNHIRQWFKRETREDTGQRGRESFERALKQHNVPYKKVVGSALLAGVIREMDFKKAEDFYLAIGSEKLQVSEVVDKLIERLKTDEVAVEEQLPRKSKSAALPSKTVGVRIQGVEDVLVRMAKCCTPVPGDGIVGYISLGKGITIHREDCPNVKALRKNSDRFTKVSWDGSGTHSFRVQVALESWDRPRLLEDIARTFAEHGGNIVEYGGHVDDQMAKNWYTVEVGDVADLRSILNSLRNLESVFDAYRVTPS